MITKRSELRVHGRGKERVVWRCSRECGTKPWAARRQRQTWSAWAAIATAVVGKASFMTAMVSTEGGVGWGWGGGVLGHEALPVLRQRVRGDTALIHMPCGRQQRKHGGVKCCESVLAACAGSLAPAACFESREGMPPSACTH